VLVKKYWDELMTNQSIQTRPSSTTHQTCDVYWERCRKSDHVCHVSTHHIYRNELLKSRSVN